MEMILIDKNIHNIANGGIGHSGGISDILEILRGIFGGK
jgi:hypothetical protein